MNSSLFLFTPRKMRNSRTNQCHSDVTLLGPSRESDPTISGQTLCDIWKILYSTSQYPPTEEDADNGDRHFDKQNPKWCLKIHQFKLVEFTRWMPGFDWWIFYLPTGYPIFHFRRVLIEIKIDLRAFLAPCNYGYVAFPICPPSLAGRSHKDKSLKYSGDILVLNKNPVLLFEVWADVQSFSVIFMHGY